MNGATLASRYEGQAYYFNGITDYIHVPLNVNPSQRPRLTMGAWAKAIASNPVRQVLSSDNSGYDRSLCIDSRGGGIGWSAFCGSGAVLGYATVEVDQWVFLAVVYDQVAKTVKLYVNDQVLTKTGVTLGEGHILLHIGTNPIVAEYFKGMIDNAFVFGDALTPEQISYIRIYGAAAIRTAARTGQGVPPLSRYCS